MSSSSSSSSPSTDSSSPLSGSSNSSDSYDESVELDDPQDRSDAIHLRIRLAEKKGRPSKPFFDQNPFFSGPDPIPLCQTSEIVDLNLDENGF